MVFKNINEIQAAIRAKITSSEAAAAKAMLKIYANQTSDEQSSESTVHRNNVGFTGNDAEILSSFSKQYQQRGSLSPKQNAILMKKIGKYAGQLTKQAIANGLYVKTGNVWVVKK